jgi:hypothetical protein
MSSAADGRNVVCQHVLEPMRIRRRKVDPMRNGLQTTKSFCQGQGDDLAFVIPFKPQQHNNATVQRTHNLILDLGVNFTCLSRIDKVLAAFPLPDLARCNHHRVFHCVMDVVDSLTADGFAILFARKNQLSRWYELV